MKPSSLRTWAIRCFMWVAGISTAGISLRLPLRSRVNMSAIGSVIMMRHSAEVRLSSLTVVEPGQARKPDLQKRLPTGFLDAGDKPMASHVPEANAAEAELAINRAGPSTQAATHADPNLVAGPQLVLDRVLL